MQISGDLKGNAFVVTLQGRIDMESSNEFNKTMECYLEGNFTPFIINCKGLEYINSTGLSGLISLSQMLDRFQLKLSLCELQPAVMEVIEIAGMSNHFNIYPTEQAALESL
ncbi:MAG: STAS domain-containing protein [Nitrospinota bacterium]